MLSKIKPEQIVPNHTHQWDSIFLIIQGAKFVSNDDSNKMVEEWPPMVAKDEGSFQASSYQNVGSTDFKALIFEFKK